MFIDLGGPLAAGTNAFINWLIVDYGDAFDWVSSALIRVLVAIETVLRGAPPALVIAAVFAVALAAFRRPLPAGAVALLAYAIGCLGLWDQAMQTLALLSVAVAIAALVGVPLGIALARSGRLRAVGLPVLDLMQTIPIFVYLLPAAMLFGLGKVPAILATVVYATPPLIRLTDLGLREVDPVVVEAGRANGASERQALFGISLPLALPSILQGLNQTVMLALGMVVVASMIGARGLGETVLVGLQRNDSGMGLVGGLAIVALAVVIDRVTQAAGRRLQRHRAR